MQFKIMPWRGTQALKYYVLAALKTATASKRYIIKQTTHNNYHWLCSCQDHSHTRACNFVIQMQKLARDKVWWYFMKWNQGSVVTFHWSICSAHDLVSFDLETHLRTAYVFESCNEMQSWNLLTDTLLLIALSSARACRAGACKHFHHTMPSFQTYDTPNRSNTRSDCNHAVQRLVEHQLTIHDVAKQSHIPHRDVKMLTIISRCVKTRWRFSVAYIFYLVEDKHTPHGVVGLTRWRCSCYSLQITPQDLQTHTQIQLQCSESSLHILSKTRFDEWAWMRIPIHLFLTSSFTLYWKTSTCKHLLQTMLSIPEVCGQGTLWILSEDNRRAVFAHHRSPCGAQNKRASGHQ